MYLKCLQRVERIKDSRVGFIKCKGLNGPFASHLSFIPEIALSLISNNITRRYLQFPTNFSISFVIHSQLVLAEQSRLIQV